MDEEFVINDNEAEPSIRLRDGLDINKLQLGEGQEFEVDVDEEQDGMVKLVLKVCN